MDSLSFARSANASGAEEIAYKLSRYEHNSSLSIRVTNRSVVERLHIPNLLTEGFRSATVATTTQAKFEPATSFRWPRLDMRTYLCPEGLRLDRFGEGSRVRRRS